jgi:hypothetical protein
MFTPVTGQGRDFPDFNKPFACDEKASGFSGVICAFSLHAPHRLQSRARMDFGL